MRCASSIITNENPPASSGSTRSKRELEVAAVGARFGRVLVGDELGDERGVGGGVEAGVAGYEAGQHAEPLGELERVGEVAVVAEREAGVADRAVHRLRVAPAARPGRGVADVADGEVTLERREPTLVEHLRDQAHVLRHGDGLAVAHRDPGRLLAPVLEGVEAQVGEVGDGLAGRVDAEDATGVADLRVVHRCSLPRTPRSTPIPRGRFPAQCYRAGAGWPSAVGRASRQAWVASARATSNAPSATRRSPPAVPRRCAGTLAARARSTRSSARAGSRATTTRDVVSENQASDGTSSDPSATVNPHSPATAISASVTARPPSDTSCTPVTSRATTSVAHELVQRARDLEIGGRRRAAAQVVQARPLRAAELGPRCDRAARWRRRRGAPGRGGTDVSSSIRPTTPTTGVGSMSRPRDSL